MTASAQPPGCNGRVAPLQASLGVQQLSTLPSAPLPGFGTGKRPGLAERTGVPGPGAYKARAALGALGVPGLRCICRSEQVPYHAVQASRRSYGRHA